MKGRNMKLFCEFDNERFGGYDVILHASEKEMPTSFKSLQQREGL